MRHHRNIWIVLGILSIGGASSFVACSSDDDEDTKHVVPSGTGGSGDASPRPDTDATTQETGADSPTVDPTDDSGAESDAENDSASDEDASSGDAGGDAMGTTSTGENGASAFELRFSGSGYAARNGQTIRAALVQGDTREVVGDETFVLSDGTFSFKWPSAVSAGRSYYIDHFVDTDGNGQCDPPPVDEVWRTEVSSVRGPTTIEGPHNTNYNASCSSFVTPAHNLTFSGTSFDLNNNQKLSIAVTRISNSNVIVKTDTTITSGKVEFNWRGILLRGKAYRIQYFIDVNGNRTCDAPPEDNGWSVDIPAATSNVSLNEERTLKFANVCPVFESNP